MFTKESGFDITGCDFKVNIPQTLPLVLDYHPQDFDDVVCYKTKLTEHWVWKGDKGRILADRDALEALERSPWELRVVGRTWAHGYVVERINKDEATE